MKTKTISIRIPVDILEGIRNESESEMRSISNMTVVLLAEALEKRK